MANRLSRDWPSLHYRWLNAGSTARKQLVAHPHDRSLSRGAIPALETKPHIEIHLAGARRAARQSEEWRVEIAAELAEIDTVEKIRHAEGKG